MFAKMSNISQKKIVQQQKVNTKLLVTVVVVTQD